MASTSKHEIELRVSVIYRMLVTGHNREDVVRLSTEKWHVSERTIDKYIFLARERMMRVFEQDNVEILAEHIAHRRNLRAIAREKGEYSLELSAAQDEAKLRNLYVNTTLNIFADEYNSFTIEQLERLAGGESLFSVITNPNGRPEGTIIDLALTDSQRNTCETSQEPSSPNSSTSVGDAGSAEGGE